MNRTLMSISLASNEISDKGAIKIGEVNICLNFKKYCLQQVISSYSHVYLKFYKHISKRYNLHITGLVGMYFGDAKEITSLLYIISMRKFLY